jgi:PadR family transcriptional regulator, regulatory protein AphA
MFLVQALDPPDARRVLESVAEHCAQELARLRPVMHELDELDADDPGGGALPFGRLAGEYGLRQYEAVHGWALWSLERLRAPTAAG